MYLFPNFNMQDLNLDWILNQIKAMATSIAEQEQNNQEALNLSQYQSQVVESLLGYFPDDSYTIVWEDGRISSITFLRDLEDDVDTFCSNWLEDNASNITTALENANTAVSRANSAAEVAESAVEVFTKMIADEYDSTKTYNPGDYSIVEVPTLPEGTTLVLYRCINQTTGSFEIDDWVEVAIANDVADLKSTVNLKFDDNILEGATWFQGTWSSFGDFSNSGTASSVSRISTQIELSNTVNIINFIPTAGAKFRVGLFNESGTNLLAMSSFNDVIRRCSYKNIKYIRITLGLTNDGHISEYNDEVYAFASDYYTISSIASKVTNLDSDNININSKLSALLSGTNIVTLNNTNLEVGSLSNGSPAESTVRARTINYIACPSSYVFILCTNTNIDYMVVSYNEANVWKGNSSYLTGSNRVQVNGSKFKLLIKYRQAPYDIDSSMLDTFGLYYSLSTNSGNNIRFTIMSHNCGKFNYGNNGGYSGDDLQSKISEWKAMLAKYKPDILLSQELTTYFDSGNTVNAFDTIFKPLFPFTYFYSFGRVSTKLFFKNGWNENISVTYNEETYSRSCGCSLLATDGIPILLVSAHLEPGSGATYEAVRALQRDKLLDFISDIGLPYVIIGGDFNTSDDTFYDAFEEAGFSVANHGYFGTINTHSTDSIDNIIVKGFSFYNAESDANDKCTSDHNPIVADAHITFT